MRGVIAGREHQPVEQLSYGERVARLQLGRGTDDTGSVVADRDELALADAEALHQAQHDVAGHDLGETGALPSVSLRLAEQERVRLLVVDGPRLR